MAEHPVTVPVGPVTLTTERLVLRAPAESDVDAVFRACQDEEVQRWTVVPVPYTREDAVGFVTGFARDGWRDGSCFTWGVFERSSGTLVGCQSVTPVPGRPHCAEVGWWAVEGVRGRGYTTEAARAVARWALAELDLRRLEWLAYVGNEGSRRVAEKVGYRFEGTLRAYADQRGTARDAWVAALLPGDPV